HQIVGSPQRCIEALERYHEDFGIDYFTIRFRFPNGPPIGLALEQIQRFGEEVVTRSTRSTPLQNTRQSPPSVAGKEELWDAPSPRTTRTVGTRRRTRSTTRARSSTATPRASRTTGGGGARTTSGGRRT